MIQQFLEGKLLAEFKTASDAAKECGIDLGSIHKVLREERKTAGGFEWKDNGPELEGVEKDDLDLLLDKEGLKESDVKSVKIWQTMKGETRYSVVLKESTDNRTFGGVI